MNRPLVIVAVAVAVARRWSNADLLAPGDFVKSYWLINYDYGFIRRGLAGEILQALFPTNTALGLVWLPVLSSIVGVAVILALAAVLIHRGTPGALATALILVCSPTTLGFALEQSRPTLLAWSLIPLAWYLVGRRSMWVLSGWFVILILMHEGVLLSVAPWLLVVLAARRAPLVDGLRLFLLPAVAGLFVLFGGGADVGQLMRLTADAHPYIDLEQVTMFSFLDDSVSQSWHVVMGLGVANALLMITIGAGLVLIHGLVLGISRLLHRPTQLTLAALAVSVAGVGLEMMLGYDWLRWFSEWTCCGLIVLGLSARQHSSTLVRSWAAWAGSAILLLLPVLPYVIRTPDLPWALLPDLPFAGR